LGRAPKAFLGVVHPSMAPRAQRALVSVRERSSAAAHDAPEVHGDIPECRVCRLSGRYRAGRGPTSVVRETARPDGPVGDRGRR
jgi:hypothetical protein